MAMPRKLELGKGPYLIEKTDPRSAIWLETRRKTGKSSIKNDSRARIEKDSLALVTFQLELTRNADSLAIPAHEETCFL